VRIRDVVAYKALTPLWGEAWVITPLLVIHGAMSELLLSKPGLLSSWVSTQAGAAVVVVDSAWAVVDSANVVVVVTPTEAIVVSDAIDDALSARSVSVVIAISSVKMVVVASARVVIAVDTREVVKGRQGPASTPERNRATTAAVRLEKRTILVEWENSSNEWTELQVTQCS